MKLRHFYGLAAIILASACQPNDRKNSEFEHLKKESINTICVDYDEDGDGDSIKVGKKRNSTNEVQVYLIENNGDGFDAPNHIYSYPNMNNEKLELSITYLENSRKCIMTKGTMPKPKSEYNMPSFVENLNEKYYDYIFIGNLEKGKFTDRREVILGESKY